MDLKPLASGSLIAAAAFFGFFLTIIGLAGMFGIWAAFLLVPALWHYCHAVLLAAAQGRRTIPTVEIDRLIRNGVRGTTQKLYLHRSLKPLDEIDFASAEDRGQGTLFGDECEGMCGV